MTKASDNVYPKVNLDFNASDQSAPANASWKMYAKADGVYARSSNSTVGPFGAASHAHDASAISVADAGGLLTATEVEAALAELAALKTGALEFVIDGGGSEIADGIAGWIEVPFACTITAARMFADVSGSIVVDIWRDTYANYPPTDADSLTASAPPTISSATKSQDTTLTGWTVSLAAGDVLYYNVDSCTTIERVTVSLRITR